ncbi:MAG: polyprenyl synthetase family protein, partial [Alistipes sp.]|nr:polyprenyl synthetase family protein [Alistipes sp.]
MVTIDSIRKPILSDLAAFDEFVSDNFNAEGDLLQEMLHHVLSSRGKGIRPILTMLSATINSPSSATDPSSERHCTKRTYLAAMLVEMIHTASLIHDDVSDSADTRRGRPSVNAQWQSNNAVILGDYILARTLSIGMSRAQYALMSYLGSAM